MMMIERRATSFSMEAAMFQGSQDHTMYPHKSQPKRIINNHFGVPNMHQMGILQAPNQPFLSQSYPPYSHNHQQPPLLPLPTTNHRRDGTLNRGLSCPPVNKRLINPTKKPKSPTRKNSPKKPSIGPLGHDPKDLSKNAHVYSNNTNIGFSGTSTNRLASVDNKKVVVESNMFSGSVATTTISPPPSSLPLPTFSLRPKLSCKVQAGGMIDTGATDDLRRLLRLH